MLMNMDNNQIPKLKNWDDDAWDSLIDQFHGKLINFCKHSVRYQDEAEDIVQDIFVKAKNNIARFVTDSDSSMTKIDPWLWMIARNTLKDYYRKKNYREDRLQFPQPSQTASARNVLEVIDCGTGPRTKAGKQDHHKLLLEGLDKIDRKYADIILMRYIDGLSRKRMAELLDISEDTVKTRLRRGLEKLREILPNDLYRNG